MCPMCITTAIVVAGVTSAGGATVLLVSRRRVSIGITKQAEPDANIELK